MSGDNILNDNPVGGSGLELPSSWQTVLGTELQQPYFQQLQAFVAQERQVATIYPPADEVFAAFYATSYEAVKVLLLGQDPYPSPGHAHGLCFSVKPGVRPPQSLVNIYKELRDDVGFTIPKHGYLMHWARQGMLMLNAVLTVRQGKPNSHQGKGWEKFTDAVIRKVSDKQDCVVFVLWGSYAQKKKSLIDTSRHHIVESAHPSPMSAQRGFFGSKCFSRINEALQEGGRTPIAWQLPANADEPPF